MNCAQISTVVEFVQASSLVGGGKEWEVQGEGGLGGGGFLGYALF